MTTYFEATTLMKAPTALAVSAFVLLSNNSRNNSENNPWRSRLSR